MSIPELLNKKFLEWQVEKGERKTLDEFAILLGVSRPLLSMWMNGTRSPGLEYKKRIIELFGAEAIEAFGEDPDLHFIQDSWDDLSPEKRKAIRDQVAGFKAESHGRTAKKRRPASN